MKAIKERLPHKSVQELQWSDGLVSRYWDYLSRHSADYFTYRYGYHIVDFFQKFISRESVNLDYGSVSARLPRAFGKVKDRKPIRVHRIDISLALLNSLKRRFSDCKYSVYVLLLHAFQLRNTESVNFARPVSGPRYTLRKVLSLVGLKKLKVPHLFSVASRA